MSISDFCPAFRAQIRLQHQAALTETMVKNVDRDMLGLPADAKERKNTPIWSGCINYFPDAIAAVAHCSWVGNEQHNPGTDLHWDRAKSGDELDALSRHLVDAGKMDSDGVLHSAKIAWRALANLQKELERAAEST